MLNEDRLCLFNASSRHKYVLTHKENIQLALMWTLAKGDVGLGTEMIEAEMIEAVEETIKGAPNKGDETVWSILTGESQLTDENAFTLPKHNIKLPNAAKRGGDSIQSWASDCDVARSVNYKASLEPESVPVDDEQGRASGRPVRACRLPEAGPG